MELAPEWRGASVRGKPADGPVVRGPTVRYLYQPIAPDRTATVRSMPTIQRRQCVSRIGTGV